MPPLADHQARALGHHLGVAAEPVAVERGLDQPALPPVHGVRAGHQTVAEDLLGPVEQQAALVVGAVVEEDLRGTYAGLASVPALEYLSSLGVTAYELLPITHIADEHQHVATGLRTYWGSSSICYLAPQAL